MSSTVGYSIIERLSATGSASRGTDEALDHPYRSIFVLLTAGGARSRWRLTTEKLHSELDVHQLLSQGLPSESIDFLVKQSPHLGAERISQAIGVSARTLRRQADSQSGRLSKDLSSKTWRFAEILALAIEVFGDRETAERWMDSEVMGLNGQKPVELMSTSVGAELVETFLNRLEHGVYT